MGVARGEGEGDDIPPPYRGAGIVGIVAPGYAEIGAKEGTGRTKRDGLFWRLLNGRNTRTKVEPLSNG